MEFLPRLSIDSGPPPRDTVKNYVGEVRAFSVTDGGQTIRRMDV